MSPDFHSLLRSALANAYEQAGLLDESKAILATDRQNGDLRREMLAEGDTSAVEQSNLQSISQALQATISDIRAALTRLENGSFGSCTSCKKEIPPLRLEARPYAATCVPCASSSRR